MIHGVAFAQPQQPGAQNVAATVRGSLRSFTGPGTYRIDAYYADRCDAYGRGIAQQWIASTENVKITVGALTTTFNVALAIPNYAASWLSLTATNAVDGSTSEMGRCVAVDAIFTDGVEAE